MSIRIETLTSKTASDYKYSKNQTIGATEAGVDIGADQQGGSGENIIDDIIASTETTYSSSKIEELIAAGINYSTEEQVIGTWIDGKPLYQKTWSGLNVTPEYNSWTNVVANDIAIDVLVDWEALSNDNHKNLNGCGIEFEVTSSYIRAEYNQNANVRTIEIITLQYTKTTD